VTVGIPGHVLHPLPVSPLSCACTHSRMISDCVSVEEHKAGKVRRIECGKVIPDPDLQGKADGS